MISESWPETESCHTQTTSSRCQADRQSPLGAEVGRDDSYTRHIETSETQANAKSLGKEDMPVFRSEARHHHSKDGEKCSEKDQSADVTSIVKGAGYDAYEDQEKCLHGAYP